MRHIHVTCAIIEHDGLVLAAQRGQEMSHPLQWEFPGGKIKPGETPEACLRRELLEELGVTISVAQPLPTSTHDYPGFRVTLYPFISTIDSGEITLYEHAALIWLSPSELRSLDWAEADLPVVESYCRQLER